MQVMQRSQESREQLKFDLPIDGDQTNQLGEFVRIEDKYIIDRETKRQIKRLAYKHMKPSYYHDTTEYTLINSLYFDSPNLDFFRHHFMLLDKRYKMRIRTYGPNGLWDHNLGLLEVKRKQLGQSRKTRFTLMDSYLERLKSGETLSMDQFLKSQNPTLKTKTLLKRLEKANQLIDQYDLHPVMGVEYKRYAFEKDGFRLTLDNELQKNYIGNIDWHDVVSIKNEQIWREISTLQRKRFGPDHYILELKHHGQIPYWIAEILAKKQLLTASFSKYCWFMANNIKDYADYHRELKA